MNPCGKPVDNPVEIGAVVDDITRARMGFESVLQTTEINYLAARANVTPEFVAQSVAYFGEPTVTEALRRSHGCNYSPGYVWGICRNVAGEG